MFPTFRITAGHHLGGWSLLASLSVNLPFINVIVGMVRYIRGSISLITIVLLILKTSGEQIRRARRDVVGN